MELSDQRDVLDVATNEPIKLKMRSLNQCTTAQRFSSVPSMFDSLGVEVPYPT